LENFLRITLPEPFNLDSSLISSEHHTPGPATQDKTPLVFSSAQHGLEPLSHLSFSALLGPWMHACIASLNHDA
jgi:hypothetical protein